MTSTDTSIVQRDQLSVDHSGFEAGAHPPSRGRSVSQPSVNSRVLTRELLIDRVAHHGLRLSLALVYVWFGVLKLFGSSPVVALVSATVPFADGNVGVRVLGAVEILLGLGMLLGRWRRAVLVSVVAHLAGTFLTVVMAPGLLWRHGNPLILTTVGEFVLKNVVLLNAALLLAVLQRPVRHASAADDRDINPLGDQPGQSAPAAPAGGGAPPPAPPTRH
jgi:putative oxidoreductase